MQTMLVELSLNIGVLSEGIWPLGAFFKVSLVLADLHQDADPFWSVARIWGKNHGN